MCAFALTRSAAHLATTPVPLDEFPMNLALRPEEPLYLQDPSAVSLILLAFGPV
jgi:hypothetical protein